MQDDNSLLRLDLIWEEAIAGDCSQMRAARVHYTAPSRLHWAGAIIGASLCDTPFQVLPVSSSRKLHFLRFLVLTTAEKRYYLLDIRSSITSIKKEVPQNKCTGCSYCNDLLILGWGQGLMTGSSHMSRWGSPGAFGGGPPLLAGHQSLGGGVDTNFGPF